MPKVLIASSPLVNQPGEHVDALKAAGHDIAFPPTSAMMAEDALSACLTGISGVVAGSEPYTRKVIANSPQLKVIARVGVGYDAVDVPAATEHGVVVCTAPGANQDAVSEHCFTLMLALAKSLIPQNDTIRAGGWVRSPCVPLRGKTLGLAGLGRIGKSMTTRAHAFGMTVIAHDPFADKEFADRHGVTLVSLEDLMRQSDYLSLHMPLITATRKIINAERLKLMKPTAYILNTARGGVIDEPALYEALRDKKIAGAGLDVFDPEPPAPDNPLLKLDNVVMTSHLAGTDVKSLADMALLAAKCVGWVLKGEWPNECVVNPEVRAKLKSQG